MRAVINALFIILFLAPFVDAPLSADWGFAGEYDAMRAPFLLAITTLIIIATVISVAKKGEIAQRIDPTLKVALVFLLACALSLVAAANKWEAIRAFLPWLSYVFLYWLITSTYTSKEIATGFCPVLIMAVALVFSVWGIWQVPELKTAVGSLGNSNYAGAFLAMTIPVAFSYLLDAQVSMELILHQPIRKALSSLFGFGAVKLILQSIFLTVVLFLSIWCLLLTDSRGGFLGVFAGVTIVLLSYLLRRGSFVSKIPPLTVAAILILCVINFAPQIRNRLSSVLDKNHPTNKVRLDVWKGSWRMTKQSPILGIGAGNYEVRYQPYRSPAEFKISNPNIAADQLGRVSFVDSAHSSYLQVLAETGFAGLIIFLYLLYVIFRRWIFHLGNSDGNAFVIVAGLGGGVAAFLVSGLTNSLVSLITHSLYFWIFAGLIELIGNEKARFRKRFAKESLLAGGFCLVIFSGFAAYILFEHAASQYQVSEGHKFLWEGKYEEAVAALKAAEEWEYANWQAHYDLALAYRKVGKNEDAVAEYNVALGLFPTNVAALNNLANIHAEQWHFKEAEQLFKKAISLAPTYFLPYKNLAQLYAEQERVAEAIENFRKALELEPSLAAEIQPIIDKLAQ